jgi:hypothetical protein
VASRSTRRALGLPGVGDGLRAEGAGARMAGGGERALCRRAHVLAAEEVKNPFGFGVIQVMAEGHILTSALVVGQRWSRSPMGSKSLVSALVNQDDNEPRGRQSFSNGRHP